MCSARTALHGMVAALAVGTMPCSLALAQNATQYHYEAVDVYPYAPLSNCVAEAHALESKLTQPGSPTFTLAPSPYEDYAVWGSDFTDSALSSQGYDMNNFDRSETSGAHPAIELFSGHGDCSDYTTQFCTASSQCTNPPVGASLPGFCIAQEIRARIGRCGVCVYNQPNTKGVQAFSYGSTESSYGYDWVVYGSRMRLGDSPTANNFSGAGTDGGDNFVIIDNSCGMRAGLHSQLAGAMFAGVRNIAFIEINSGDTADVPDRGTAFGDQFLSNRNGAIAWAWANSLNNVTGGSACGLGGGYHGVYGCGTQITLTADSTCASAVWNRDSETWSTVQYDIYDANGASCWTYVYHCNWDCQTYPPVL